MSSRLRTVVIVGGGIAGLTAAETLRREGFDGEITIVGDESHAPYSRPALSKSALLETSMTSHLLPEPEHGARTIIDCAATGIDCDRRLVRLSDGALPYDGLVIASGSRARRLSTSAAEFTLRGLDDAEALRGRLAHGAPLVVIGGGPLGMEIASCAAELGSEVTLISRGTPMKSHLGEQLGGALAEAARAAGVHVILAAHARVTESAAGESVVALNDGTSLATPTVVSAIGDVPNVEWLDGSGLLSGRELRVDSRGRIAPGIVAAGDVAAVPSGSGWNRLPLWTSAIEQAKIAAVALMRGDDAPELDFQPYFWTEQFGISVKACGPLPVAGDPDVIDGSLGEQRALLRWDRGDDATTAVAFGYRIPIPRLRAHTRTRVSA